MKKKFSRAGRALAAILAGLAGLAASPGAAVVVGGGITGGTALGAGGVFVELDPTTAFSIGNNNFNDNNLYAFNEDQNIAITSTISVDVGTSPVAGDIVASHYIGFDPGPGRTITGYVDFDAAIYGIATTQATLAASDFLANTAVTYENPVARGLETSDSLWIDPLNPNRVWLSLFAASPGDYVRVFTRESPLAPVPVPASGLLLLGALTLLARGRRKRSG